MLTWRRLDEAAQCVDALHAPLVTPCQQATTPCQQVTNSRPDGPLEGPWDRLIPRVASAVVTSTRLGAAVPTGSGAAISTGREQPSKQEVGVEAEVIPPRPPGYRGAGYRGSVEVIPQKDSGPWTMDPRCAGTVAPPPRHEARHSAQVTPLYLPPWSARGALEEKSAEGAPEFAAGALMSTEGASKSAGGVPRLAGGTPKSAGAHEAFVGIDATSAPAGRTSPVRSAVSLLEVTLALTVHRSPFTVHPHP